jgi:hypothetical protein
MTHWVHDLLAGIVVIVAVTLAQVWDATVIAFAVGVAGAIVFAARWVVRSIVEQLTAELVKSSTYRSTMIDVLSDPVVASKLSATYAGFLVGPMGAQLAEHEAVQTALERALTDHPLTLQVAELHVKVERLLVHMDNGNGLL